MGVESHGLGEPEQEPAASTEEPQHGRPEFLRPKAPDPDKPYEPGEALDEFQRRD